MGQVYLLLLSLKAEGNDEGNGVGEQRPLAVLVCGQLLCDVHLLRPADHHPRGMNILIFYPLIIQLL